MDDTNISQLGWARFTLVLINMAKTNDRLTEEALHFK
jgi:hypothetical protein